MTEGGWPPTQPLGVACNPSPPKSICSPFVHDPPNIQNTPRLTISVNVLASKSMSNHVYKAIDPTQIDKPILSPADMLAIEEDPSRMETMARMLGAVNLDNLFRHMQNNSINPMARIEFQKMLNKLGRLEPDTKADVGQGGPQVVINITRAKDHPDGLTIEGSAQALEDGT